MGYFLYLRGSLCRASITAVFFVAIAAALLANRPTHAIGSVDLLRVYENPTAYSGGVFGFSLASDDGLVVIGDTRDGTTQSGHGRAFVFDSNSGELLFDVGDPSPEPLTRFTAYTDLWDTELVLSDRNSDAGVGHAHVVDSQTGEIVHTYADPSPQGRDIFPTHPQISDDYFVAGDPWESHSGLVVAGTAYVFDRSSETVLHELRDPTPRSYRYFGGILRLVDGRIFTSARGASDGSSPNEILIYDAATGELEQTIPDPFHQALDEFGGRIEVQGDLLLTADKQEGPFPGATPDGEAYLFRISTGALLHTFNLPNGIGSEFGASLALDGRRVLIGATGQSVARPGGQAFLFDAYSGELVQVLEQPDGQKDDWFGSAVAIDGPNLFVAARFATSSIGGTGRVYQFVPEPQSLLPVFIAAALRGVFRRQQKNTDDE